MNQQTVTGWTLLSLLMSTLVLSYPQTSPAASSQIAAQYIPKTAIDPQHQQQQQIQQQQQFMRHAPQHYRVHGVQGPPLHDRKFAEKPNALKKVALDDIDADIQTNQIQDNLFSWSNMLGSLMTMLFNNAQMGGNFAPSKSDDVDTTSQIPPSPWTNVISVGEYPMLSIIVV